MLLSRVNIDQIWVEGGATAAALIQDFRWNQLIALPDELAFTPIPTGPLLRIKTGSYPWPDSFMT
ncbi:MAG: hypothetical protein ABSH08_12740 [Tepidisphaeraceae bacterium]|jgi:hypothetical protein